MKDVHVGTSGSRRFIVFSEVSKKLYTVLIVEEVCEL